VDDCKTIRRYVHEPSLERRKHDACANNIAYACKPIHLMRASTSHNLLYPYTTDNYGSSLWYVDKGQAHMKPVTDMEFLPTCYTNLFLTQWMANRPMYLNSHAPNASSIYDYTLETICKTLETNTIPATQKPMYRYLDQAITLFFSDAVREISPTLITRYNAIAQTKIRA